ncbi:MAG: hypothetical protein WBA16_00280 [Nonlabens sp.]
MKTLTILFLLINLSLAAQPPLRGDVKRDRLKALMVAHITESISLTSNEAQEFWPIYNQQLEDRNRLERRKRSLIRGIDSDQLASMTDKESYELIDKIDQVDQELQELNSARFQRKILTIIGPTRFLMLKKAEVEFRRKMIGEWKRRKR